MSGMTDWIAAAAEETGSSGFGRIRGRGRVEESQSQNTFTTENTEGHRVSQHQNPHLWQNRPEVGHPDSESGEDREAWAKLDELAALQGAASREEERERRIYRGRTINMLLRYMRYSMETGRLPSVLGQEFFRAKVTSYRVVTFEDRVIFVHDMETCMEKLDEFSRQLIARHVLQGYDQASTGRLLGCSERTVRSYVPIALDLLSEILLDLGLLERIAPKQKKTCQEGESDQIPVSDCEESKNNF